MDNLKKMVCPNGCDSNFSTVGHVMQEWEVNAYGEFVSVIDDCIQITHGANRDNIWTCRNCGAEGIIENIR